MKLLICILLQLTLALNVFANDNDERDATPTLKEAKQIAIDFAVDKVFSDFLSAESSLKVRLVAEDNNRFTFKAKAQDGNEICVAIILVSKELGEASLESEESTMTCHIVQAVPHIKATP